MADAILLSDLLELLRPLLSVDSPDLADVLKLLPNKVVLLIHENEGLRAEKAQHKIELDKTYTTFKTALAFKNRQIKELQAENEQLRGRNEELTKNDEKKKKEDGNGPKYEIADLPNVEEKSERVVSRPEQEMEFDKMSSTFKTVLALKNQKSKELPNHPTTNGGHGSGQDEGLNAVQQSGRYLNYLLDPAFMQPRGGGFEAGFGDGQENGGGSGFNGFGGSGFNGFGGGQENPGDYEFRGFSKCPSYFRGGFNGAMRSGQMMGHRGRGGAMSGMRGPPGPGRRGFSN